MRFSATLLNTFHLYLNDDSDYYTEQKVIDALNRTVVMTDRMKIGSEFGKLLSDGVQYNAPVTLFDTIIHPDIINAIRKELDVNNAIAEVRCDYMIDSNILIYGYADFVNRRLYEVKTTGNYEVCKYQHMVQHKVYAIALNLPDTCYLVTDFKDWYKEEYLLDLEQIKHELYVLSHKFVEWIDAHKESINFQYITDK
jgi:hypothetical protein